MADFSRFIKVFQDGAGHVIFDFVENGGSRHVGAIADLHRFPPRRSAMAHSRTARRGPAGGVQSRADIPCNAVRIRW